MNSDIMYMDQNCHDSKMVEDKRINGPCEKRTNKKFPFFEIINQQQEDSSQNKKSTRNYPIYQPKSNIHKKQTQIQSKQNITLGNVYSQMSLAKSQKQGKNQLFLNNFPNQKSKKQNNSDGKGIFEEPFKTHRKEMTEEAKLPDYYLRQNQAPIKDSLLLENRRSTQLISVVQKQDESSLKLQTFPNRCSKYGFKQHRQQDCNKEKRYKLEINEQAIRQLLSLKNQSRHQKLANNQLQHAAFCSIVGKTKTGKSFLLNQLLEQQRQNCEVEQPPFQVNHILAPCTKGIWISRKSYKIQNKGMQKNIIFLDTQGLGSYESTQQIDYKIFTLSILLSDVLCYNSLGPIDQQMLNGMAVAVQIRNLMNSSQQSKQNKEKQKLMTRIKMPSLFWLLRDFSLQLLTEKNVRITSDEYLQRCLQLQNKNTRIPKINRSKQNIRAAIKSVFSYRKCCTLVLPFDEKNQIRGQFKQNLSQIKQKFKQMLFKPQFQDQNHHKIQDFICKLRAYVQCLNGSIQAQNSSQHNQFKFPRFQSLEVNFIKTKITFEFKRINQAYSKLFEKYQNMCQQINTQSNSKQLFQQKINKIKVKLKTQIVHFKNDLIQRLRFALNIPQTKRSKQVNLSNKTPISEQDLYSIDLAINELKLRQINNSIIKVLQQSLNNHQNSLRLGFQQINQRITEHAQRFERIRQTPTNGKFTVQTQKVKLAMKTLTQLAIQVIKQIKLIFSIQQLQEYSSTAAQKIVRFYEELRKTVTGQIENTNKLRSLAQSQMDTVEHEYSELIQSQDDLLRQLQLQYLKQRIKVIQRNQAGQQFKQKSRVRGYKGVQASGYINNKTSKLCFIEDQTQLFSHLNNQNSQMNPSTMNNSISNVFSSNVHPSFNRCHSCQKSLYVPYITIPTAKLLKIKFVKMTTKQMPHQFRQFQQYGQNVYLDTNSTNQYKKRSPYENRRFKLEFIVEVELNTKKWHIRRKLKDFLQLNKIINIMFCTHYLEQSHSDPLRCQEMSQNQSNTYKQSLTENRGQGSFNLDVESILISNNSEEYLNSIKQQLEQFILRLSGLQQIRNSRIFQKFVKINKEYLAL